MEEVRKIAPIDKNKADLYWSHTIYRLSDEEIDSSGAPGRYMLNRTYSDFALNKMDRTLIIKQVIKDSEYVYGVGFFDTIKEAELYYKCCIIECIMEEYRNTIKKLKDSIEKYYKEDNNISVFNPLK